jgi:hypothetical protein
MTKKLISLNRDLEILVNQPREMTVSANEINTGKDLPVVRNLPIKVTSQRASSSGSPKGPSSSSKPVEGGDLKRLPR